MSTHQAVYPAEVMGFRNYSWLAAALIVVMIAGCAPRNPRSPGVQTPITTPAPAIPIPSPPAESEPEPSATAETAAKKAPVQRGTLVAQSARALLGQEQLVVGDKSYRYDCSGLVMAAHARAGIPLLGSTRSMFALARSSGALHYERQPFAGDVVFFDNTYDRNRNGQRDDPLSHVAVVQSVDEDGTIQMVHKSNRGVLLFSMNLHRPGEHKDSAGKVLNDFLRSGSGSRSNDGPVLAGQLWRAFASFWALDGAAQSSGLAPYAACRG